MSGRDAMVKLFKLFISKIKKAPSGAFLLLLQVNRLTCLVSGANDPTVVRWARLLCLAVSSSAVLAAHATMTQHV